MNSALEIGNTIDTYSVIELIGTGGNSKVWKVETNKDEVLALKMFYANAKISTHGRSRFKAEYEKARVLSHPNILTPISYGEWNSNPYITMPFCHGNLADELVKRLQITKSSEPLFSERELAKILFDISSAILYLQAQDVSHQDIKPENILLFYQSGEIKNHVLSDFGISERLRKTILLEGGTASKADASLTPSYASPEQLQGQVHGNSDVFSLGVSIYELAEGKLPVLNEQISPASTLLSNGRLLPISRRYSNRFKLLLESCLALIPGDRPSATELHLWSAYYLRESHWPDPTSSISTGAYRPRKSHPRKKRTSIKRFFAPAAVVASLLALAYFFLIPESLDSRQQKLKTLFIDGNSKGAADYLNTHFDADEISGEIETIRNALDNIRKHNIQKVQRFHSGGRFAIVTRGSKADKKVGVIDNTGNIVVDIIYSDIEPFTNGYARVRDDIYCGFVNENGDTVCGLNLSPAQECEIKNGKPNCK